MKKKKETHVLSALPAIFLFVFWPCLVHMDLVDTNLLGVTWYPDWPDQYDFFMHIKSNAILIFAVIDLILILDYWLIQKKKIFDLKLMWPLLGYILFAVISTIFSINPTISMKGMIEQYEQIWILLSYMVIFWYFCTVVRNTVSLRMLMGCLLSGSAIQCLIGFSQMINHDFWNSKLGMALLTMGAEYQGTFEFAYNVEGERRIYLSFYNPNYAGVYLMLMIPLALFGIWYFEKKWQKICSGVLTASLLICLYGTDSKTGYIILVGLVLIGGFFLFQKKRSRYIFMGVFGVGIAILILGVIIAPANTIFYRLNFALLNPGTQTELEEISLEKDYIQLDFGDQDYRLRLSDHKGRRLVSVEDAQGQKTNEYHLNSEFELIPELAPYDLKISYEEHMDKSYIGLKLNKNMIRFQTNGPGKEFMVFNNVGKADTIVNPPVAFGRNSGRLLSGRVFLWGRSLPILKRTIFIGTGPDTFAFVFPHNDYLGRIKANQVLVDNIITKVHNMYLQWGIQTGLVSLILLLFFFGRYIVKEVKGLFLFTDKNESDRKLRLALFLSVLGFLMMGMTNDSVVVTAPLFWAILGIAV